jgi:hypothetical protein
MSFNQLDAENPVFEVAKQSAIPAGKI